MKISEMLSLAVQGYSAGDIKELAEMQKENPGIIALTKSGAKLSEIKDLLSMADAEETPAKSAAPEPCESDKTPDYHKMYEDQKAEIEKLRATVSEIQEKNASKEIPQTAADPLESFLSKF